MKKNFFSVCFFLLVSLNAFSQLTVSGGFTAQQLAEALAGPNITVFNAQIVGAPVSYGKFQGGTATNLGLNNGVVLTSGSINNMLGPNNSSNRTTVNNTPGDADLTILAEQPTFDATYLQFDFQVQTESIEFEYVFGSDEYTEFILGQYNDVFAFYISGPGIVGKENMAVIPATNVPISTGTVNQNNYWQYYIDNPWGGGGAERIQYDGFTTVLKAKKTGLIPCQIYTLKLAISDAGDDTWDCGVMLKEGSLVQGTVSAISNSPNGNSNAFEGCTKASFTFNLNEAKLTNTQIKFNIRGSAINGVDYNYIDSIFTIPAGQTSATVFMVPKTDGTTEGNESVFLIYEPYPCAPKDTVKLYINDSDPLNYTLSGTNLGCNGNNSGQINIANSGGFSPYNYTVVGLGSYTTSPITNLPAGTYTVRVSDSYGCAAGPVAVGSNYSGGPVFLPDGNGQVYQTALNISGFGAGQTLTSLNQLTSICMTMEHSAMGEVLIELIAPDGRVIVLKELKGNAPADLGEPIAKGPVDGNNSNVDPGVGYGYCFTPTPTYGTMVSERSNYTHTYVDLTGRTLTGKYLPAGSYQSYESLAGLVGAPLNGNWTLRVTDSNPQDNGWVFDWGISLNAGDADSVVVLTQPVRPSFAATMGQPACGATNGFINITTTSPTSITSYSWNNGATTKNISNLSSGAYKLTAIDANLCSYDTTFLLQNNSTLLASITYSLITCNGNNNGKASVAVTGGTPNFTYLWSNGSTNASISNLAVGNYNVKVTDNANCSALKSVSITQPQLLSINASATNETCGEENGQVAVTIAGGTTPYTFQWSNGSTNEDINFLQAGTYSLTVRDANLCTTTATYTIINEVSNCVINCNIEIGSGIISNENCGNADGAINISVLNGSIPYTFNWNNNKHTEDITGLFAGTYSVVVIDDNLCEATATYTVINQTSGFVISNPVVTNETCGNKVGAIAHTVSGGVLPYKFLWSNGATNRNITGLSAGTYTLTVTDAVNCKIVQPYTILNNSGTLLQTYGNAVNEVCTNSRGSIDISIAGGNPNYSYRWNTGQLTQDLINISSGTYVCTITDLAGCKIYTPQYVVTNQSGTLAIFDTDIYDEVCSNTNGRINVDMIGGQTPYSFLWSNGSTNQFVNTLSAGTYTCRITDFNACVVNTPVLEVQNATGTLQLASIAVTNEICDNNLGAIDVEVIGGTQPLTYTWSNFSNTQDLTNLSEGNYSCIIKDVDNCQLNINTSILNTQGTLQITSKTITNETCGNANGAFSIVTSGGSLPLAYTWNNANTNQNLTGLVAGYYAVEVRDNNGCKANESGTLLNQTGTLAINSITANNEVCGNSGGSINLSVTGSPLTYTWSNGATTQNISGLQAGTYTCTIKNSLNCKVNTGNVLIQNTSSGFSLTSSAVNENCSNSLGSISLTTIGGVAPLSYTWSNGSTNKNISGLTAGTYTVTAKDAGNCSVIKTVIVGNNVGTLAITNALVTAEICDNNQGSVQLQIGGGQTPYSFLWSNGSTNQNISALSFGTYTCRITDNNNCRIFSPVYNVTNNSGTLVLDNVIVANEECNNDLGSVLLYVSGGTSPYTFAWNNGATTENITGLSAGNYTCLISDDNGCSINVARTVNNDIIDYQPDNFTVASSSVCLGQSNVIYTVPNNTLATYTWSYSGAGATITGTGNSVSVNFSLSATAGTLSVRATTSCGVSSPRSIAISIVNPPAQPSAFTFSSPNVCQGQNNVLYAVTNNPAVSYTWSYSGAGATINGTGNSVLINYSNIATSGVLSVTAVNGCGASTARTISVSVGTITSITSQPASVTVAAGSTTSFSVSATGNNLNYQWQINTGGGFNPIFPDGIHTGQNSPTLTVTGITVPMNGYRYRCFVSGFCGGFQTSSVATLSVILPACTGAPNAGTTTASVATVCNNAPFTLSLTGASLVASLTYQWQISTNNVTYSNISSATAATLVTTQSVANYYRCVVTCASSSLSSNSTPLLLNMGCGVLMSNGSTSTCSANFYDSGSTTTNYSDNQNLTHTFNPSTVGASIQLAFSSFISEENFDFITIHNGPTIGAPVIYGPASGNLTIPTLTSTHPTGALTVQFTSDQSLTLAGWQATVSCTLPCTGTPNVATTISSANAVCPGEQFTLSLNGLGSNSSGLNFLWQQSLNNVTYNNIPMSNFSTLDRSQNQATYYRCVVTCPSSGLSATSLPVRVLMTPLSTITSQPVSVTENPGDNTNFSITATGTGNFYQWQVDQGFGFFDIFDDGTYFNTNSTTLDIINIPAEMDGYIFRCLVYNSCFESINSNGATLDLVIPPCSGTPNASTIVTNQNPICEGGFLSLSLTGLGSDLGGLTYQWQTSSNNVSFTNLVGETASTLNLFPTQDLYYRCVVRCTSSTLTRNSTSLLIDVINTVSITSQPLSTGVIVGGTTSFTVGATGSGITYQWLVIDDFGFNFIFDGGNYSGTNTATLTVTNANIALDGNEYICQLFDDCGNFIMTNNATLTILTGPCSGTPSGGNSVSNLATVCGNTPFTLSLSGSSPSTGLTYQWQISSDNTTFTPIPGATSTTLVTTQSANNYYRCVVTCTSSSQSSNSVSVLVSVACDVIMTNGTTTTCGANFYDTGGLFGNYMDDENLTHTFYPEAGGGSIQLNFNSLDTEQDWDFITIFNGPDAFSPVLYGPGSGFQFPGILESTDLTGAITVQFTSDQFVTASGWDAFVSCTQSTTASCSGSPDISTAIASSTNVCSSDIFSLSLSGLPFVTGFTYQWQSSTNNISYSNIVGATSSTLNTSLSQNTYYRCRVTCSASSLSSNSTSVFVELNTATIISQPSDISVVAGSSTSFEVVANGNGLSYQWQANNGAGFNNLFLDGIHNNVDAPTLDVMTTTLGMNGDLYRCIITDACGSIITSSVVTLTVTATAIAPSITSNPLNVAICGGLNTFFSISATGSNLTYQWQQNDGFGFTNIVNGGVYSNATTSTLLLTGVTSLMNGYTYQCVVTGITGTPQTSEVATLTIETTPIAPTSFVDFDTNLCAGDAGYYSVSPIEASLTYNWSFSETGATINVLTSGAIFNYDETAVSGYVSVVTSNTCGVSAELTQLVTISSLPSIPYFTDSVLTVCQLQNAVKYAVVSKDNITYTWSYSGSDATLSANANELLISFGAGATSGKLTIKAETICGINSENSIDITVAITPEVIIKTSVDSVCVTDEVLAIEVSPLGGTLFGTGVIANTFNPAYSGIGTFVLTYTVKNENNCTYSATKSILVYENFVQDGAVISLFPNPSNGEFYLRNLKKGEIVQIYNTLGQVVYYAEIQVDLKEAYIVNIVARGVYEVRVLLNSEPVFKGRVEINR
ncbi:MAG: choice-of-anchor L domain-containing protein [Bacteroidota bacterium]